MLCATFTVSMKEHTARGRSHFRCPLPPASFCGREGGRARRKPHTRPLASRLHTAHTAARAAPAASCRAAQRCAPGPRSLHSRRRPGARRRARSRPPLSGPSTPHGVPHLSCARHPPPSSHSALSPIAQATSSPHSADVLEPGRTRPPSPSEGGPRRRTVTPSICLSTPDCTAPHTCTCRLPRRSPSRSAPSPHARGRHGLSRAHARAHSEMRGSPAATRLPRPRFCLTSTQPSACRRASGLAAAEPAGLPPVPES